jgi:hypothetical protein
MTVRRLEDGGDISTSGTQFITEANEIAQTIESRLRLFLGEYFRDILDGTPWFEQVLGKGQPLELKEAVIRRRILQTGNVQSIFKFDVDFDEQTRKYTVAAGVVTPFGPATVNISDIV